MFDVFLNALMDAKTKDDVENIRSQINEAFDRRAMSPEDFARIMRVASLAWSRNMWHELALDAVK